MDINSFNAARAYGAAQKTLAAKPKAESQETAQFEAGFSKTAELIKDLGATVAEGEKTASDFMVGKADPHSVVEALASAELAVETAVTLRNKVVEAYQELMRMPV